MPAREVPAPREIQTPSVAITIPDTLRISPEGRAAIETLARAQYFGGWALEASREPSEAVLAWRTLLIDPSTLDGALGVVLDQGTTAGRLMALAAMWHTLSARFEHELERFRQYYAGERVVVMTPRGRLDPQPVERVLERPDAVRFHAEAVRQAPEIAIETWRDAHRGATMELDIVGGGYTAVMLSPRHPLTGGPPRALPVGEDTLLAAHTVYRLGDTDITVVNRGRSMLTTRNGHEVLATIRVTRGDEGRTLHLRMGTDEDTGEAFAHRFTITAISGAWGGSDIRIRAMPVREGSAPPSAR